MFVYLVYVCSWKSGNDDDSSVAMRACRRRDAVSCSAVVTSSRSWWVVPVSSCYCVWSQPKNVNCVYVFILSFIQFQNIKTSVSRVKLFFFFHKFNLASLLLFFFLSFIICGNKFISENIWRWFFLVWIFLSFLILGIKKNVVMKFSFFVLSVEDLMCCYCFYVSRAFAILRIYLCIRIGLLFGDCSFLAVKWEDIRNFFVILIIKECCEIKSFFMLLLLVATF